MIKLDLFQGWKDGSASKNQSVYYTTLMKWRMKIVWSSQQMLKKQK